MMQGLAPPQVASVVAKRAADLRLAFDSSFASPTSIEPSGTQDFLAVRIGPQKFALRLADISGLFTDKKITFVPGGSESLLGIAGFRGVIAPVYDLQRIFGYPAGPAARWLIIARAAPIGFAFDAFDGRLRTSAEAIASRQDRDQHDLTCGVIHVGGVVRSIVDLSHVLDVLRT
ncbi:MAG: chemotaxis protein CheW [Xanthobacteraceae bacterium]